MYIKPINIDQEGYQIIGSKKKASELLLGRLRGQSIKVAIVMRMSSESREFLITSRIIE